MDKEAVKDMMMEVGWKVFKEEVLSKKLEEALSLLLTASTEKEMFRNQGKALVLKSIFLDIEDIVREEEGDKR